MIGLFACLPCKGRQIEVRGSERQGDHWPIPLQARSRTPRPQRADDDEGGRLVGNWADAPAFWLVTCSRTPGRDTRHLHRSVSGCLTNNGKLYICRFCKHHDWAMAVFRLFTHGYDETWIQLGRSDTSTLDWMCLLLYESLN